MLFLISTGLLKNVTTYFLIFCCRAETAAKPKGNPREEETVRSTGPISEAQLSFPEITS